MTFESLLFAPSFNFLLLLLVDEERGDRGGLHDSGEREVDGGEMPRDGKGEEGKVEGRRGELLMVGGEEKKRQRVLLDSSRLFDSEVIFSSWSLLFVSPETVLNEKELRKKIQLFASLTVSSLLCSFSFALSPLLVVRQPHPNPTKTHI